MRALVIAAVALVAIGLVWMGQGLGLLRGSSFMVDDTRWAVAGAILAGAGAILAIIAARRRRAP
jgi:hypothetical protein